LSRNQECHQKWKGYVESKIRRLLQFLENTNNNLYNKQYCLEFRPWPAAYNIGNKIDQGFEKDDTYYFGLRIKNMQYDADHVVDPQD
jgi:poly(A) polymerase Pap1